MCDQTKTGCYLIIHNNIYSTIRKVNSNAKLSYKLLRDVNLVDIESAWAVALKIHPRRPTGVAAAKCKANLSFITYKKQNSLLCSRYTLILLLLNRSKMPATDPIVSFINIDCLYLQHRRCLLQYPHLYSLE